MTKVAHRRVCSIDTPSRSDVAGSCSVNHRWTSYAVSPQPTPYWTVDTRNFSQFISNHVTRFKTLQRNKAMNRIPSHNNSMVVPKMYQYCGTAISAIMSTLVPSWTHSTTNTFQLLTTATTKMKKMKNSSRIISCSRSRHPTVSTAYMYTVMT